MEDDQLNEDSYVDPTEDVEEPGNIEKTPEQNDVVKVIVRDLTYHCTEDDLVRLFEGYPVLWVIIKRNEQSNHSLLHGFVHLASKESAESLVEAFHGHRFMGRKLKIQLCGTPPREGTFDQVGVQVFVRYESLVQGQQQQRVTEETIVGICSQFGSIEDVLIRRHNENLYGDNSIKYQKGYGFVYFSNIQSTYAAEAGTPIESGHIVYKCELAHKSNGGGRPNSDNVNFHGTSRHGGDRRDHSYTSNSQSSNSYSSHSHNSRNYDRQGGRPQQSPSYARSGGQRYDVNAGVVSPPMTTMNVLSTPPHLMVNPNAFAFNASNPNFYPNMMAQNHQGQMMSFPNPSTMNSMPFPAPPMAYMPNLLPMTADGRSFPQEWNQNQGMMTAQPPAAPSQFAMAANPRVAVYPPTFPPNQSFTALPPSAQAYLYSPQQFPIQQGNHQNFPGQSTPPPNYTPTQSNYPAVNAHPSTNLEGFHTVTPPHSQQHIQQQQQHQQQQQQLHHHSPSSYHNTSNNNPNSSNSNGNIISTNSVMNQHNIVNNNNNNHVATHHQNYTGNNHNHATMNNSNNNNNHHHHSSSNNFSSRVRNSSQPRRDNTSNYPRQF